MQCPIRIFSGVSGNSCSKYSQNICKVWQSTVILLTSISISMAFTCFEDVRIDAHLPIIFKTKQTILCVPILFLYVPIVFLYLQYLPICSYSFFSNMFPCFGDNPHDPPRFDAEKIPAQDLGALLSQLRAQLTLLLRQRP